MEIVGLESVLCTAAQALFRYDISRILVKSSGGFIVEVTIGFILSKSARTWILDPPFMQYDAFGVK